MTPVALRLKNKKVRLWKRYIHTKSTYDHRAFLRCKNQLRNLTRDLRIDFESHIVKNMKDKPKLFWKYAKSRLKTRETIPNLKNDDGSFSIIPKDKAESFNNYFSSVFSEEDLSNIPSIQDEFTGTLLESINITKEVVLQMLMDLNPNKSPGPDGWHPYFLQQLANELAYPLSMIFQKSLNEKTLPDDWLKASITPIHKKGAKNLMSNYRPVSLTSVICKIFERIIRNHLLNHLVNNQLLADEQHGFVPQRTCITNLLSAFEDWSAMIDEGIPFDIIFTDFAKAFDSVPHARLIRKLKSLGIRGDVLGWIKAFLNNRKQRVIVEGESSTWSMVMSGIPQGSVLGPMLFVVFINDLPQCISSFCKMFADDAKIYKGIEMVENTIQQDLDEMFAWSQKWQLPFNQTKCKSMHLGKNNPKTKYMMSEHMLCESNEEKDLGVIIDNTLKFHIQTATSIKKANSILGLVKKSFAVLNKTTLPLLYKSMIRPHLEYGNVIWGPHYKGDQKSIEKVQKRATKLVPSLKDLPYNERLRVLNLPSLSHRRRRGDMIETYKILSGKVNVDKDIFFRMNSNNTRGHNLKLSKLASNKVVRSTSFSRRVIDDWNSLPSNVVNALTINNFKAKLDKHWQHEKFISVFD